MSILRDMFFGHVSQKKSVCLSSQNFGKVTIDAICNQIQIMREIQGRSVFYGIGLYQNFLEETKHHKKS